MYINKHTLKYIRQGKVLNECKYKVDGECRWTSDFGDADITAGRQ